MSAKYGSATEAKIDFVALRYFHETQRAGSIRAAAERLHVTPSSVSRMIAALEQDFGALLFERSKRGMRLTDAGVVLARQTHRMFRDFERVRGAIDDLQGLRRGKTTIYGAEGLVAEFLPKVLSEFTQKHPNITFAVFVGSTDRIVEAVIDDEADIGITFNGPRRPDLSTVVEYSEPLRCLVAPSHPLANRRSVRLDEVVNYPLALPETSFGMRRMIDDRIDKAKLSPKLLLNTNSLELAKRYAMTGEAVAFMPGFMVADDLSSGRLVGIEVSAGAFDGSRVTVCVHRDRELSYAAREMLSHLSRKFSSMHSS